MSVGGGFAVGGSSFRGVGGDDGDALVEGEDNDFVRFQIGMW